jgi:hypothetical protein
MAAVNDVYALAGELWPEAVVFELHRPPTDIGDGEAELDGYTLIVANANGGVVDQCSGISIDELYANLNRRLSGTSSP